MSISLLHEAPRLLLEERAELLLELLGVSPPAGLKSVMEARGIPFTDFGRTRLDLCEDAEWVEACIRRAVTATTEAEVFGTDFPKIQEP